MGVITRYRTDIVTGGPHTGYFLTTHIQAVYKRAPWQIAPPG